MGIYEINDEYMGTVFEVSYYDWVIKISGIVGDVFLLLGVGYKKNRTEYGVLNLRLLVGIFFYITSRGYKI